MEGIKVIVEKKIHDGYIAVVDSDGEVIAFQMLSGEAMYQMGDPKAVQLYLKPIISGVFNEGMHKGLLQARAEVELMDNPARQLAEELALIGRIESLEKQVEKLQKEKQELSDARDFLEEALSLGKDISLQEDTPESKLLKRAYTALEEASASSKLKGWEEF